MNPVPQIEVVNGPRFRISHDLRVSPLALRRIAVIGSCMAYDTSLMARNAFPGCETDYILVNNAGDLPNSPPRPLEEYDCQLVMLGLRHLLPDRQLFRLPFVDGSAYEVLFEDAKQRLALTIDTAMAWAKASGMPAFVANFLTPQQASIGRLLPRYELRNSIYFIEKLNEYLGSLIKGIPNAYTWDLDEIAGSIGRQYVQEDHFHISTHGGYINDWDFTHDQNRIQPIEKPTACFETRTGEFLQAAFAEIDGMMRTIRGMDAVKLVVIDLDDTLWRGVAAEEGLASDMPLEGWPIGFVEALLSLKHRGLVLAIASKNSAETIERIWDQIFHGLMTLDDFAIRKINWRPKTENMGEILAEANLLPRSAVFIDDNPVERAAMLAAFPDIRVLGANPYHLRRAILWAPETQVAAITDESGRRTEMIQSQVQREGARKALSREEFLASLGVKIEIFGVSGSSHPQFARTFELLNKTNQFNTTGKRWTTDQLNAGLANGLKIHAFEVMDKYTHYGLVGVLLVADERIEQFVMSCRVVGLGVEQSVLAGLAREMAGKQMFPIRGCIVETDANVLSRDLYEKSGFLAAEGEWILDDIDNAVMPVHVELSIKASAFESTEATSPTL